MLSCCNLLTFVIIPLVAITIASFAGFFILNPMLFDVTTGVPHHRFPVMDKHFMLDGEMAVVGGLMMKATEATNTDGDYDDVPGYRNHCLRVLTFATQLIPSNARSVYPNANNILAMTCAFSKVGLWVNNRKNKKDNNNHEGDSFLQTSVDLMQEYIRKEDIFDETHIELARLMILHQYKWSPYKSSNGDDDDQQQRAIQDMVNAFRIAVWADTTMGILRTTRSHPSLLSAPFVEAAYAKVPALGFHSRFFERLRQRKLTEVIPAIFH